MKKQMKAAAVGLAAMMTVCATGSLAFAADSTDHFLIAHYMQDGDLDHPVMQQVDENGQATNVEIPQNDDDEQHIYYSTFDVENPENNSYRLTSRNGSIAYYGFVAELSEYRVCLNATVQQIELGDGWGSLKNPERREFTYNIFNKADGTVYAGQCRNAGDISLRAESDGLVFTSETGFDQFQLHTFYQPLLFDITTTETVVKIMEQDGKYVAMGDADQDGMFETVVSESQMLGDMDGDCQITPDDAAKVLELYAKNMLTGEVDEYSIADYDGNGRVDPDDVTAMLKAYASSLM